MQSEEATSRLNIHYISEGRASQRLWERCVRYVLILGGYDGSVRMQTQAPVELLWFWFRYLTAIQIQAAFSRHITHWETGLHYRNIISAMGNNAWKHAKRALDTVFEPPDVWSVNNEHEDPEIRLDKLFGSVLMSNLGLCVTQALASSGLLPGEGLSCHRP
ncbi:unnamed protein product [Arctogadus glacialis]